MSRTTTTGSSSARGSGARVSALRLAEKGYAVAVLECGRRFRDEDFPRSTWDLRRYFWAPRMGLRGIFRLTPFKDVSVVSGCGVGGGSLGYANTLYVPPVAVLRGPAVGATSRTGRRRWRPTTPRRSGCSASSSTTTTTRPTSCCASSARSSASATPTARPRSASSSASPGKTVPDPYFDGEGPGPHRLHAVRPLHGRLPARRQEHAGQELPLARRAPRRRGDARPHRDRRSARSARPTAARATRSTSERSGPAARPRAPHADRARRRRRRRRRWAPTSCSQRCRLGGSLPRISAAARRAGPHQQRSRSSPSPCPRTTPTT